MFASVRNALEVGTSRSMLVRREIVEVNWPASIRILYASDLHLRPANAERIASELLMAVKASDPDLVLLGGDLTDHPASLKTLKNLVGSMAQRVWVGAVDGNHDTILGVAKVRDGILSAGGHWLSDQSEQFEFLQVLGRVSQFEPGKPAVLCSHYPTVFPKAFRCGVDLVFAGHLHGWQVVLGQRGEYLYPGAWLSRWNGLRFQRQGSTMLVSRGMTDLLPLRWNCPREVILADCQRKGSSCNL